MSTDLDDLKFDDVVPPEPSSESDVGPLDLPPITDDLLSCTVCGKPLTYGGRGRKPTKCDEHKKASGKGGTRRAVPNDKLAASATEALVNINRLTGFGARILRLPNTAAMFAETEDMFRAQAYEALLVDPDLCRQILAAGQMSGRMSLLIAYGMLAMQIAPVAAMEIKQKQAERKAAKESDE
jgi:hypothetical protein